MSLNLHLVISLSERIELLLWPDLDPLQLQQGGASGGASAAVEAAARAAAEGKDGEAKKTYKFWSTQVRPRSQSIFLGNKIWILLRNSAF